MSDKMNPDWIATGKAQVAQFFDVSVNTVSAWLLRGCPTLEPQGRAKFRFYLPEVVGWLGLGGPSDSDEPAELSIERAKLARAQTEKSKVETELKKAQLGHVLAGGMIPRRQAQDLFQHGEVALMQAVARMTTDVPLLFLDSGYYGHVTDQTQRLRFIIDENRFVVRDAFRKNWETLFRKYAGDPYGTEGFDEDGNHGDETQ